MLNLCPSRLASVIVDVLSFATLTLSTDEKLGRERHKSRAKLPEGSNDIVPIISMPLFVVSMVTGSMPSGVSPAGKQETRSLQKMKSSSRQTSEANAVVGYFFKRVMWPNDK